MRRRERVTNEELVEVAARLFDERGFVRTRAEDIAAALNIAKPTLYARVTGKADLLDAVIRQVMDALGDALSEVVRPEDPPLEALRRIFDHHVRQAIKYRAYFNVFFRDERELPASTQRDFRSRALRYNQLIVELIADAQRAGDLDPDLDPTVAAANFLAVANWVCRWYRKGRGLTPDDVVEQGWRLLSNGLQGRVPAPVAVPVNHATVAMPPRARRGF